MALEVILETYFLPTLKYLLSLVLEQHGPLARSALQKVYSPVVYFGSVFLF